MKKEHSIIRIMALSMALVILAPVAMKLAHVFNHHEHKVCSDNSSVHFHELDNDCSFYKFKLNNNTTLDFSKFDFFIPKQSELKIISLYYFISKYQLLHFSLRGPPSFV